jgi:hypothetical protein
VTPGAEPVSAGHAPAGTSLRVLDGIGLTELKSLVAARAKATAGGAK